MDFQVLAGDLLPAKPDYRIERLARNVAIPLNVQLITNCTTGVGSNTQICSELGVTLYYSTRAINKGDVLALSRNSRHALLAGMDMMSRQREGMLSAIIEYLHSWDESGGLEHQPISMLMTDFYQYNRCMDFHLLAMSCATGLRKLGGNHP